MRTPKNIVLIELEKESENEYVFSNGHKIHLIVEEMAYKDGSYNPNNYTRIYGDALVVPDALTKDSDPVCFFNDDTKYANSIVPEVEAGDRIYFYYNTISEYNLLPYEGKLYYRVPYTQIICAVRKGQIIPVGGHILLTPYYGEGIVEENIDGHKVYGKMIGALFFPIGKPENQRGKVTHIGTPLIGHEKNMDADDIVFFPRDYDVLNNIEGVEYYTMRQHEVLGVLV